MAVYEVQGPNGELYEIEGPDDADPSAVVAQLSDQQNAAPAAPAAPAQPEFRSPWQDIPTGLLGLGELAASAVTSLPAMAIAGVAGGGSGLFGTDPSEQAEIVRDVEGALTYQPQSEGAQMIGEGIRNLGDQLSEYAPDFIRDLPETAERVTGGPGLNVATGAVGEAFADLAPVGAVVRPIARAVKAVGAPRAAPKLEGPQLHPAVERARRAGYNVRPTDAQAVSPGANVPGTVAERLNDPADLSRDFSQKNQLVTNKLVAEEFGLPEGSLFDDATFDKLKDPHFKVYNNANDVAMRAPSEEFTQAFREGVERVQFKAGVKPTVTKTIGALRRRASKNINSDDVKTQEAGYADQRAAEALEDALGKQLEAVGEKEMLGDYRDARKSLAKIHDIEVSSQGGFVNAQKLKKIADRGGKLTGRLKIVAEAAEHLPSVTRHTLRTAGRGLPKADTIMREAKDIGSAIVRNIPGLGSRLNVRSEAFQNRLGKEATAVERSYFSDVGAEADFAPPVDPSALGDQLGIGLGSPLDLAPSPGRIGPAPARPTPGPITEQAPLGLAEWLELLQPGRVGLLDEPTLQDALGLGTPLEMKKPPGRVGKPKQKRP